MRRTYALVPFLVLMAGSILAQSQRAEVIVVAKSQTDKPATPGQATDEATAAAHYLQDRIAIEIQNQYPCAVATTDRDIGAMLDSERQHSLLDGNYEADLSNLAGAMGARHVISVTAIQTGGRISLKASCIDTATAKVVAMQDKASSGNAAADDVEALARGFVASLGGFFAVKPGSGRTYPAGTVFAAVGENSYDGHALVAMKRTYAQTWDAGMGTFPGPTTGAPVCTPRDWGSCGGCSGCTCAGGCTLKLTRPGRYRLVNETDRLGKLETEIVAEVTIAGSCRK